MDGYFLRSERLGWRWWGEGDVELAIGLWGDAAVTRLIGGPFSREQVVERLRREMGTAETDGVQYWPVFLRATGEHVGCCGLRPYGTRERMYELGFHLRPGFWGQGYGEEAARAVIGYGFGALGAAGLFAGHHPANGGSRRLLLKLGFVYAGDEFYAPTGLNHPSYWLVGETAAIRIENG